ncbi:MAG: response regulator [Patescibacteria group bacterium]
MLKQAHILIMEADTSLQKTLQAKLSAAGYRITVVSDGELGLKKIDEGKPDLVMVDLLLPKINGFQVLENFHRQAATKGMPVIAISATGQPGEIKRILDLGVSDYLIKTELTPQEVVEKVAQSLGGSASVGDAKEDSSARTFYARQNGISAKILMIEDDKFLGELCTTKLSKEGFAVSLAVDGEEGLQKVIQERPDLVLLDIILPGKDGFEVLEAIRHHDDAGVSKTPIILLSNLGQESNVERGIALGANDYLVKANFTTDEIVEKVLETLRKNKK